MTRTAVLSNWWRNSNRTTLRGFTGHEMVDGVDVINMNGRIYDAHIGRFLQADPIVQEVGLIDNLNRYSYVLNNPLNATDPSGYVFNKFIRSFAGTMSHIFGEEVTYAFGATVFGYFGGALGASYWDYQFNRAMGATSSQAFRSSATTFAVSAISYGIGTSGLQGYQKVLAHGVVGGLAAEAQGGDFVAGFFASGVAKGFSEAGGMARVSANGFTGVMTRTAIAAMIGGTVSEMTGGKFANGARTATLQHLFNYETERARAEQKGVFNKSLSDNIRRDENGNLIIDISVGAETGQEPYRDLLVKKISGAWEGKGGCNFLGFSCDPALTKMLIVNATAVDGVGDITVYSRRTMASFSLNARKWERASYCSGACATTGGNRIHIGSTSMRAEAYLHEVFHNFGHLGHTSGMMGKASGGINASNIQYLENLYGL